LFLPWRTIAIFWQSPPHFPKAFKPPFRIALGTMVPSAPIMGFGVLGVGCNCTPGNLRTCSSRSIFFAHAGVAAMSAMRPEAASDDALVLFVIAPTPLPALPVGVGFLDVFAFGSAADPAVSLRLCAPFRASVATPSIA